MTTRFIVNNGFSSFQGIKFFTKGFQRHGRKAIIEWSRAIQKRAVFGTRKKKTGRLYKFRAARRGEKPDSFARYNKRLVPLVLRNIPHRASAKTEYPAADTGILWRSIRTKVHSGGLSGLVYTNIKYGRFLEEKSTSRGGRPFLSRAAKEKEKLGQALVLEALQRSAREAS